MYLLFQLQEVLSPDPKSLHIFVYARVLFFVVEITFVQHKTEQEFLCPLLSFCVSDFPSAKGVLVFTLYMATHFDLRPIFVLVGIVAFS